MSRLTTLLLTGKSNFDQKVLFSMVRGADGEAGKNQYSLAGVGAELDKKDFNRVTPNRFTAGLWKISFGSTHFDY